MAPSHTAKMLMTPGGSFAPLAATALSNLIIFARAVTGRTEEPSIAIAHMPTTCHHCGRQCASPLSACCRHCRNLRSRTPSVFSFADMLVML
mmetsp:Transcript_32858/g.60538  ORF Transcript_32858/g.60538 Transcript_32858/m.60538 type:complete len:92 (-) Transcript_32858:663-938(-)